MASMTDDDKIAFMALMLGDVPGGPYYPMFTEEQYKQFLLYARGDVNRAVVAAAMSAAFMVAGESSREVIGELQISASTSTNYLKLLDYLIATTSKIPPAALMPWFAGVDECNRNKLLDYNRCDPDWFRRERFHLFGMPFANQDPCGGRC